MELSVTLVCGRLIRVLIGASTQSACHEETKEEASASAQFADESPLPTDAAIFEDVYFEVDRQTEAGRTGKHFFHD